MPNPVTGINESFKFGSTTYDADDCLQSGAITDAVQEILMQCGGFNVAGSGPRDVTFTVSMGLAATDVTKINALEPDTIAALEIHPAGDTFGYIEVISTSAKVMSRPINYGVAAFITMDVTFRLNDVTFQAASS